MDERGCEGGRKGGLRVEMRCAFLSRGVTQRACVCVCAGRQLNSISNTKMMAKTEGEEGRWEGGEESES